MSLLKNKDHRKLLACVLARRMKKYTGREKERGARRRETREGVFLPYAPVRRLWNFRTMSEMYVWEIWRGWLVLIDFDDTMATNVLKDSFIRK